LCWCGSGKKFKKCHLNRESAPRQTIQEVIETGQTAYAQKICLHPDPSTCKRGIIKAHSVQQSSSLDKIAVKGKVYGRVPPEVPDAPAETLDGDRGRAIQTRRVGPPPQDVATTRPAVPDHLGHRRRPHQHRIAAELCVTLPTVGKWRTRFAEKRLDGLTDEPRPGPPRTISNARVERVVTRTLESKPANATHWSTRGMAKAAGLSQTAVSRIWRAFGLKPHLHETFKLSTDPPFVENQDTRSQVLVYRPSTCAIRSEWL
jgi:transposase